MSRVGAYQAAAARCGTLIERNHPEEAPRFGGAITKHPLAREVAEVLIKDLRQLGAEAKIYDPRDPNDDRVFVYLSGCSFQKGDLPVVKTKVTEAQAALLTRALAGGDAGIYIYGSEVRAARALEKLGLLPLVDDGESPMGGNRDGERWSIEKLDQVRCAEILNARSAT